jgi:hypothetical protein
MSQDPMLLGVDFTCAPTRRKPITAAWGRREGTRLQLQRLQLLPTMAAFEAVLATPGPWLGAFDLPFGLPRSFVRAHRLGSNLAEVATGVRQWAGDRMAWRAFIDRWGNAQPPGQRLPHRATDRLAGRAGSTSPLQTRYVPVGLMYFEGLPRLLAAGVSLAGLHQGDPGRIAIEGYPGRVAQLLIGSRSYKNDASAERHAARAELLALLEQGTSWLPLPLQLPAAERRAVLDDAGGDRIDALLCLATAAWAATQPRHGLPPEVDAVEGWIVSP